MTFTIFKERWPLWTYWETPKGGSGPPAYIRLCLRTFENASELFDVRILNERTVLDFLPDLRTDINSMILPLKADYIRVALLERHGGLWLDADTIVMTNGLWIVSRALESSDFVGFGCSSGVCSNGMMRPSNGAMGSRRGGEFITRYKRSLDAFLDSGEWRNGVGYFEMGKLMMWKVLDELSNKGYEYAHMDSWVDGSRDSRGIWITPDDHVSVKRKRFMSGPDGSGPLLVFLANTSLTKRHRWFVELEENRVLSGRWMLSSLLREALGTGRNQSSF
jgi:hypothetical protein